MNAENETVQSIRGRLDVLTKGMVSEENSVQYYDTLIEKTLDDSEENRGKRRMYADLKQEELKHVERFKELIAHWERKLKELEG